MNKSDNLIGKKFGFLTVESMYHKQDKLGRNIGKKWVCVCDCGNKRDVGTRELIHNITYSCGCKLYVNLHKNRKYAEEESSFRAKVSTHIAQAKNRNIAWELTYEEAIILLKSNCHYCGRQPNKTFNSYTQRKHQEQKNKYEILCNGIDRVDSNVGYISDNVVPCCKICNFAKNNLAYSEFISWINDLIKYRLNEK